MRTSVPAAPQAQPSAIVRASCFCLLRRKGRCSLCRRVERPCAEYVAMVDLGAHVSNPIPGVFAASSLYPINGLTGRPA